MQDNMCYACKVILIDWYPKLYKRKDFFLNAHSVNANNMTFHKNGKTKQENVGVFFQDSVNAKLKLLCFDHADYNKSAINH